MPLLSPRIVALPAVALAVIIALAQAHGRAAARDSESAAHQVTSCAAPANSTATCLVADNAGATLLR